MPVGCTSKTAIETIDTVVDGIELHAHATELDVDKIENHIHVQNKTYGLDASTGNVGYGSTVPIIVTGGNNAFGTEVLLDKGNFGGTYYDPGTIQVSAVTAANSPTLLEFYSHVAGSQIAYTMENDDDKVTAAGIAENDLIIFDTIVEGDAHGVTRAIVYHALAVAAGAFNVSLTQGGAAVTIDADLTGFIRKLTPTLETDKIVTCAATTADALPITLPCPRIASTKYLSVKAKSKSGDTTGVSFFLDVHTYAA